MFGCVCVCVFVCKKREKRCVIQKRLRVYVQNVPVYAGSTRTCVETCRVLPAYTEAV